MQLLFPDINPEDTHKIKKKITWKKLINKTPSKSRKKSHKKINKENPLKIKKKSHKKINK